MIKLSYLHWEPARIAELLFFTTGFVPNVVIIRENLQLKKRPPLKGPREE
jgi:hypothetical protein